MNRRQFLARLGGGAAVLASLPLLGVPGSAPAEAVRHTYHKVGIDPGRGDSSWHFVVLRDGKVVQTMGPGRHHGALVFDRRAIPKDAVITSARVVLHS